MPKKNGIRTAKKYTPRRRNRSDNGHSTNGSPPRTKPRPALSKDDRRLARIRAKPPQSRTNAELAYEEGAELGAAFPVEIAEAVAGILSGVPSLSSALVFTVPESPDRLRFASAIVDFEGYFGRKL